MAGSVAGRETHFSLVAGISHRENEVLAPVWVGVVAVQQMLARLKACFAPWRTRYGAKTYEVAGTGAGAGTGADAGSC